ncbi:Cystinosin [Hypsibius exemplaris]|uniref:Cystinosin homolog n=1 Tax=Hypsibius exemplaris TaxID=2072580 RepID=A0A9X6NBQ7_HYPEX|nr:Cystinosin [Hypsibius exemplaris]
MHVFFLLGIFVVWSSGRAIHVDASDGEAVSIAFEPSHIRLESHQNSSFILRIRGYLTQSVLAWWTYDRTDLIAPLDNLTLPELNSSAKDFTYSVETVGHAGVLTVGLDAEDGMLNSSQHVILTIAVVHSIALATFSDVVGWIYFVAWSISFYPQVIVNYRRKSVSGLSFDFLALNITGFLCYTIFNVGLFWIPEIQDEYFARHPRGVLPVEANDVFFAIHAVCLTIVQIAQCFIYPSDGQRLFKFTIIGLGALWLASVIMGILAAVHVVKWLDYLYYFSYVKLGITLIKYIPQAWMNFRRKSTVGWSIGNVLLDFTGGVLSLAQLFVIAYNFDDWTSTVGNPTKIGLGLLSIFFDVVFIVQHYVLYRKASHKVVDLYPEGESVTSSVLPD